MSTLIDNGMLGTVLISLGTIGSVVWTFTRLKKNFQDEIDAKTKNAIKLAEAAVDSKVQGVENQLEALKRDLENLETSVQKEISFVKATYNSEIKNLSDKIEHMRDELRSQHTNLLTLISKLVDSNPKSN